MNFSQRLTQKTPRRGEKSPDDYNFGLNQSYALDYKMTETINTKFNRAIQSNLNDYRGYMSNALKNRDPGVVTNIAESFTSSFSPTIMDWLKPTFNYTANYRWNKARDTSVEGANIGNQLRFSSGISLSPLKLVELIYKPSRASSTTPQRQTTRETPTRSRSRTPGKRFSEEEEIIGKESVNREELRNQKNKKEKKDRFANSKILKRVHGFARKVNPLNISYTENVNKTGMGVLGEIPLGYRLGLMREHGLDLSLIHI